MNRIQYGVLSHKEEVQMSVAFSGLCITLCLAFLRCNNSVIVVP